VQSTAVLYRKPVDWVGGQQGMRYVGRGPVQLPVDADFHILQVKASNLSEPRQEMRPREIALALRWSQFDTTVVIG
jgi:hypothetical protein